MDKIHTYSLKNNKGLEIEFINIGGKLKSINIPENESFVDILLGYDSSSELYSGDGYMGAICGRVANRIGNGVIAIDGAEIKLAQNDRTNHLHGGFNGFNTKIFNVNKIEIDGYTSAFNLTMESPDGDENYPGKLKVNIAYALNDQNEFLIDIKANTDKTTAVNLTSHPYFNLNGVGNGKIFNHLLEINANEFTPLNSMSVPTGEIQNVIGTDMDFNKAVKLTDRINSSHEQIRFVGGLDHNWVIKKQPKELGFACRVSEPDSGRAVEVYTTQPGIQVYTSMHFDGSDAGKGGIPFTQYCAIALEAQNFPDAPNKPNFPNAILKPNETYYEKIIYKFRF